jgi:hypothetical protein
MPTVAIGDNTGDDYSGTEDARLWEGGYANYNTGALDVTAIYKYSSENNATHLQKFSGLSNISSGVMVSSASFSIYRNDGNVGDRTITARRLLVNWVEGTGQWTNRTADDPDSCCWNEYGSGNAWATAGGLSNGNDRSSTVSGTFATGGTNGYKTISTSQMASDVEGFINGTLNNYGWHFERTDGANDETTDQFVTSEGVDGQRPYLTVTYEEGGATGNTYYYQQMQM